ncbi:MAG: head GIN domain-containing protein [Microscillaceae bacterium]|nr:head GIN domain-containing protein [Microscillaceae bacterium]
MKLFKICIILISVSFGLSACDDLFLFDCRSGRGPMMTETRDVNEFDKINHQISGEVFVTQGNTREVKVIAQESILDEIQTTVVDGELRISLRNCVRNADGIQVYVTTPQITALELSGSGNISAETQIVTDDLLLRLSGSGSIHLEATAGEVESRLSGSGNIVISGSADTHRALVSGSGGIRSFAMNSRESIAEIRGSGDIELLTQERLDVKISGSGTVRYKGNPTITSNITGSGNLQNAN